MKKILIVIAAVAALGLGALLIGGAATSAQEGDGPLRTFLSKVADKLGVSEDELTTAMKEARIEMIDEAVADGRLTEEQGEKLKERVEEGDFPFVPFEKPGLRFCDRARGFLLEAAVEVLDIPKDELAEQLKDGKSLAEVAEAQGMDVEEFKDALIAQAEAQLDSLVEDEKLTQEQADRLLEGLQEKIDRIVNAEPSADGGCHGPRWHRPGPGPFGEHQDYDESQEGTEA